VGLIGSREILSQAGVRNYGAATEGMTLAQFYGLDEATPELTSMKVVRRLKKDIDTQIDLKSGVIGLTVTARNAELARALNHALLDLVNQFNLRTRQSQARAERIFAEARLAEVRDSLRAAEDRLQGFLQRNRDYRNSPELAFQQDRLAREVALQQAVAQTLLQGYEQAKLQEVRDIPVLTIIGQPELPPRADGRGVTKKPFLVAFLAAVIAIGLAFFRELRTGLERSQSADAVEFRGLVAAALGELRAVRDRFRRSGSTGP
jgi:uncharacterized protein involved in exopolysaccharide biosynthesis